MPCRRPASLAELLPERVRPATERSHDTARRLVRMGCEEIGRPGSEELREGVLEEGESARLIPDVGDDPRHETGLETDAGSFRWPLDGGGQIVVGGGWSRPPSPP